MVRVRFLWEAEGLYDNEDEDVGPIELETYYDAETWQEACNDAADCYDWDDEDCINFEAESDLSETTRSLTKILIQEDGKDEVDADQEVYEYYNKAEEKAMGI
jgi:hypothetical protein|tara:strand:- start:1028 stop:1336 length:309 start_codon:yes stop_codon:yes gene_type:complete